jgi:hypothetical protein
MVFAIEHLKGRHIRFADLGEFARYSAIALRGCANAARAIDTYYLLDIKAKNSRIIAKWQLDHTSPLLHQCLIRSLDGLYPPVNGPGDFLQEVLSRRVCLPDDCVETAPCSDCAGRV